VENLHLKNMPALQCERNGYHKKMPIYTSETMLLLTEWIFDWTSLTVQMYKQ